MSNYLSNETMLEFLKQVQREQAALVSIGRSAHLDVNVHENTFPSDGGTHITFGLTVFEGDTLSSQYEFNAGDTEEQIQARIASLVADINALSE